MTSKRKKKNTNKQIMTAQEKNKNIIAVEITNKRKNMTNSDKIINIIVKFLKFTILVINDDNVSQKKIN